MDKNLTKQDLIEVLNKNNKQRDKKLDDIFAKRDKKLEKMFEKNNKLIFEKIDSVQNDILFAVNIGFDGNQKQFDAINDQIFEIKNDIEDIKLRLDNTAHRFELNELQQRVRILEKKVGIARRQ